MSTQSSHETPVISGAQFERVSPFVTTEHGSARVSRYEGQSYISNIVVDHARRGQGHGTELMRKVLEGVDERGDEAVLSAREELHPWYQRLGFVPSPGETAFGLPVLRRPRTSRG